VHQEWRATLRPLAWTLLAVLACLVTLAGILTTGIGATTRRTVAYTILKDPLRAREVESLCSRPGPTGVRYWAPEESDVQLAEELLPAFVADNLHRSLSEYRRQYVGLVADGRRVLYINVFSNHFAPYSDWTYEFVSICDGRDDSWGVIFDPERMEFASLQVDGSISGPYRPPDAAASPNKRLERCVRNKTP
jgi:hypothetical protein